MIDKNPKSETLPRKAHSKRREITMASYLHEDITQKIIESLEKGVAPWVRPWQVKLPVNAISQNPYNGVNILLLWFMTGEKGYQQHIWLTFNQAKDLGGTVKKGEKGTRIIYTSTAKKKRESEAEDQQQYSFLKSYTVFNLEQTEGLPEHLFFQSKPIDQNNKNKELESFIQSLNATIKHGGEEAFYQPQLDFIQLPHQERFKTLPDYYATNLHEHAHWSGHKSRLNRDLSNRFGSEAYAAEELIAELAGAFLCAQFNLEGKLMHAEYIASWLMILKNDKQAIFTAASQATKITEYFNNLVARA